MKFQNLCSIVSASMVAASLAETKLPEPVYPLIEAKKTELSRVAEKELQKNQEITHSAKYQFVISQFITDEPNHYREALFAEQRPAARDRYESFLHAKLEGNREHPDFDVLVFCGAAQRLYHIAQNTGGDINLVKEYVCSSARGGFSNRNNSDRTPTGLLFVQTKQGANAEVGKIFDYKYNHLPDRRIIPGQNTGSKAYMTTRRIDIENWRGIAIHGTNHEAYLGRAASGGCIRMSNEDVIDFFDSVRLATPIYISTDLKAEMQK